jgi:hypothetical protein
MMYAHINKPSVLKNALGPLPEEGASEQVLLFRGSKNE